MAVDPTPQQSQPQLPGIGPPFTGLYLDRPAHAIPPNGFSVCNNVRIYKNRIDGTNMGFTNQIPYNLFGFGSSTTQGSAITGGGILTLSYNGFQYLIIANLTDIYAYTSGTPPAGYTQPGTPGAPFFITPVYTTGTVDCDGAGNLTGHGTSWQTAIGTGFRNNMRPGDYIYLNAVGSSTFNTPGDPGWFKIATVTSNTTATLTTVGISVTGQPYTLRQTLSSNTTNHVTVFETYPNAAALGADFTDTGDLCILANAGGTNFTTSLDPMVYWNPKNQFANYLAAGAFISVSGFTNCRALRRFSNVLCYGGLLPHAPSSTTALLGTEMASSDNGDPRTFSSGIAFQGAVSDGADPIIHIGILGNAALIYCGAGGIGGFGLNVASQTEASIISASFVGLPTVWQFQTVVRNNGAVGNRLVVEFTDRHEFIGTDCEYRYNGMFIQAMNDHIWRSLLAAPSTTVLKTAFGAPAPSQGDVLWVFPQAGETGLNNVYVEHYMEQASSYLFKPYSQRDGNYVDTAITPGAQQVNFCAYLGANPSFNMFSQDYSGPIIGDTEGNILTFYNSDVYQIGRTSHPTDFVRTFTLGARVMAGERSRGLIKRIYPFIETASLNQNTATTITVTITLGDRIGGRTIITDTQTLVYLNPSGTLPIEPTNRFTTHYRRGRVGSLTISGGIAGNIVAHPFICDGYDWDLPGHGSAGPGGQR